MIDVSFVRDEYQKALQEMKTAGLVGRKLENYEIEIIAETLSTYFSMPYVERDDVIEQILKRHTKEILVGAMLAKEQMDAEIDGMFPESGKIGGPIPIRAAFLGIGKDWDDIGSITTGTAQYWIHSGTALLGGTAGRPVRIGRNAVHVIFGIGDYHPSPKLESVKFELNGQEQPIILLSPMRITDVKIVELQKSIILKRGTTILATVYATDSIGASVDDIPYLFGVSFILDDKLRIQDPTQIPGTVHDVVTTT
jgi:hypothetical protein